jgi:hypothetical protein
LVVADQVKGYPGDERSEPQAIVMLLTPAEKKPASIEIAAMIQPSKKGGVTGSLLTANSPGQLT